MKIYFGQIYVEPGVEFPFSHFLQLRLSEEASALIKTPDPFTKKFGDDWSLMFRISAKRRIQRSETYGPTIFRKTKDVEYSVFLPFDVINEEANPSKAALQALLSAASTILKGYGADTDRFDKRKDRLIDEIVADPTMFLQGAENKRGPNHSADRMPGTDLHGESGGY